MVMYNVYGTSFSKQIHTGPNSRDERYFSLESHRSNLHYCLQQNLLRHFLKYFFMISRKLFIINLFA